MSASATQGGHKKLNLALVALYSIWPGNGMSLFLQSEAHMGPSYKTMQHLMKKQTV